MLFREICLKRFLSFGPDAQPIPLRRLNLIIGPNGAGKSNLLEAFELLHAVPTGLDGPLRVGGSAQEWIWKGPGMEAGASVEARFTMPEVKPELRYRFAFAASGQGFELTDEVLENAEPKSPEHPDPFFYYRYQGGRPVINVRQVLADDITPVPSQGFTRTLRREDVKANQSILSQRRDPQIYPEITAVADALGSIQILREWQFGRTAALRRAQDPHMPTDTLLPAMVNLGHVLNGLEHGRTWSRFTDCCRRFLPRFQHLSTRIQAGTIQLYLHEEGLAAPVPATRLSDGTIRFLCLLAVLLTAERHPLICIEEPELGLHPDAIALLAELIAEAAQVSQLIVTTHSDVLVSAFSGDVESVLVCEHMPGTGTTLRRLEAPKLAFWLEKYRLGEIWRLGEIGGNP